MKLFVIIFSICFVSNIFAAMKNIPQGDSAAYLLKQINRSRECMKDRSYRAQFPAPTHFWRFSCRSKEAVELRERPEINGENYSCRAVSDTKEVADAAWGPETTTKVLEILVKEGGVTFRRNTESGFLETPSITLDCAVTNIGCIVEAQRFQDSEFSQEKTAVDCSTL